MAEPGDVAPAGDGETVTGASILRRTVRRQRARMITSTIFFCIHQLCETMVPIAIGMIVGVAIETGDAGAMIASLLGLVGLFVVLSYAFRFGARIIVVGIEREAHAMRVEVAAKVLHPRGVRTELVSGELLTVATSDAEKTSWILDVLARTAAALTAVVVCAVALLIIDVPLGLAVLIGTPVIMFVLHKAAPLLTRRATAQQAEVARVSAMATDLVSGVRPLRGIGAEDAAATRFVGSSRTALGATLTLAKANSTFQGVSAAISALLSAGVAGGAGLLALQGRISVAELIAVVGLAQFLIEPLGMMSRLPGVAAVVRGSADRLALVLNAKHLVAEGDLAVDDPSVNGLTLNGIGYRSLVGVDLEAAPGEIVGVVAIAARDGDALAAVLSGQLAHDDYEGSVTIGKYPMRELSLDSVRSTLLVEPHNTDLFAGTLRSNITLDRDENPESPRIPLDRVLAASAAHDVVAIHERGLDHEITDRGSTLSGGQRQRVALGRALAADAPILVLHDPTTAVDAVTENHIAQGIADLRHEPGGPAAQTTLVISTSPALLAVTHRVIVIDEGQVVASGVHADLAVTDERYRQAVLR